MKKQTIANKKWDEKNRSYSRYLKDRSGARSFIRNKAKLDDIKELRNMLDEKEKELRKMTIYVLNKMEYDLNNNLDESGDTYMIKGSLEDCLDEIVRDVDLNNKKLSEIVYQIDNGEEEQDKAFVEWYKFNLNEYRNLKNATELIKQQIDFEEFDEIKDTLDTYNLKVNSKYPSEILEELELRLDNFIEDVIK